MNICRCIKIEYNDTEAAAKTASAVIWNGIVELKIVYGIQFISFQLRISIRKVTLFLEDKNLIYF